MMGYGRGYYGSGEMMGGGGWFIGLLGLLFGVLVIAAVVLLVMWAIRVSSGHGHVGSTLPPVATGHDEAVAIARRRLASGEITKEQFDEIMRALGT